MKKWFTDLDEDVRVKLMEDHKNAELIEYGREITDEQAFNDLEDTCWETDGLVQGNLEDVLYLDISDKADVIVDEINNSLFPDITMKYQIRRLLIEISHLEGVLKIWKP